jgi:anti-sigma B factor antagonist
VNAVSSYIRSAERRDSVGVVNLEVNQRRVGDAVVLTVSGEVDLATAEMLRDALVKAEGESASGMVLDLHQVGFLDSTGIGELVGVHRRLRKSGRPLALVVPQGPIRKILAITGMDGVLDLYDDEPSALAALALAEPGRG